MCETIRRWKRAIAAIRSQMVIFVFGARKAKNFIIVLKCKISDIVLSVPQTSSDKVFEIGLICEFKIIMLVLIFAQ